MTEVSPKILKKDIKKSNDYLAKNLHIKNHSIAYPYGKLNEHSVPILKSNGIKYGFTEVDEVVEPKTYNYKIPRILVSRDAFNRLIKEWTEFKDD